jgi:hypothetical protein
MRRATRLRLTLRPRARSLAKLAFSHRRLGPSTFRLENTRLVSTGFSY